MKIIVRVVILAFFGAGVLAQSKDVIIHFDFGRSMVTDSSVIELQKVMSQKRYLSVVLEGHCDSVGHPQYNQTLSEKRAEAFAQVLVRNGMERDQILQQTGYGKGRPLNNNKTEQARFLNRRVVVRFYSQTLSEVRKEEPKEMDFDQLKGRETIVMENILFEPGRHILKEESFTELEKVKQLMMDHPTLEIEILGHVCCTPTEMDGFDQDTGRDNLSEERAYAVYNFLIQNGIEEFWLSYKGYGGTRKIYQEEDSEAKRRVNRRVEFRVIRK